MGKPENPDRKFDLRTLEFQLNRGELTQKEYDQYLKSVPDDEGNYNEVVVKEEEEPANPNEGSFEAEKEEKEEEKEEKVNFPEEPEY